MQEILQQTNRLIRTIPEVDTVYGKAGRAESATDPAPLTMIETTIQLKPKDQWRPGVTMDTLKAELDQLVQVPSLTNTWIMPIKNRIDMLATGIKTPVGVKVAGPDLKVIAEVAQDIERVINTVPGTASVYAERVTGGRFVDVEVRRVHSAFWWAPAGLVTALANGTPSFQPGEPARPPSISAESQPGRGTPSTSSTSTPGTTPLGA